VRKFITWIVVTVGIAALVRKLRRRSETGATEPATTGPPTAGPEPPRDDPAAELREKLAESRTEETFQVVPPEPEPTVEERRDEVHGQGRAAIDEMQRSAEDPAEDPAEG
jgi:hypothetical protein